MNNNLPQTGMMPSGNNLHSLGIKPKPELTREQINMTVDMLERINNCMKREGNDWYDTGDFMLMLSND